MIVLTVLAGIAASVFILPAFIDLAALGRAALRGRRRAVEPFTSDLPRLLFLIPAHDEELLVGDCVRSALAQDYPPDRRRIVVIADNCKDDTAVKATLAGAECLVRDIPHLRGKPNAIVWALERLPVQEFDALVIIDADSVLNSKFARALAAAGPLKDQCAQTYNGVSNPDENALTRMAHVFGVARHRYVFRLKRAAGLNVPVANGLCIGSSILARYGWPAFGISEVWELYARYTALGVPMTLAEHACVVSQEAKSLRQSGSQRRRWSAGRLDVLIRTLPDILKSRRAGWLQKLDVVSELSQAGPVVQLGASLLIGAVLLVLQPPGAHALIIALGLALLRPALYATLGIMATDKPVQAAAAFLYLPVYAVWRLGVQVSAIRMIGSRDWVRTSRHSPSSPARPDTRDG